MAIRPPTASQDVPEGSEVALPTPRALTEILHRLATLEGASAGFGLTKFDGPAGSIWRTRVSQQSWFWANLTNATQIGASNSNRWAYDWHEVKVVSTATDPSGYQAVSGGRSSTTGDGAQALNSMEGNNSTVGTQGCGVNVNNFTGNFALVPIGANESSGAVVQMYFSPDDKGNTAFRFQAPNQPDGSCTGTASGTGTGTA